MTLLEITPYCLWVSSFNHKTRAWSNKRLLSIDFALRDFSCILIGYPKKFNQSECLKIAFCNISAKNLNSIGPRTLVYRSHSFLGGSKHPSRSDLVLRCCRTPLVSWRLAQHFVPTWSTLVVFWLVSYGSQTWVEITLHGWPPVYFVWILLLCLCFINNSFTCLV